MVQLNRSLVGLFLLILIHLNEAAVSIKQQVPSDVIRKQLNKQQMITQGAGSRPLIKIIQTQQAYIPEISQKQYSIVNSVIYQKSSQANRFAPDVPKDSFVLKLQQQDTNKPLDQKTVQKTNAQAQIQQKTEQKNKKAGDIPKQQQIQQKQKIQQNKDVKAEDSQNIQKELINKEQENIKVQQQSDQHKKQENKEQELKKQVQTKQKEQAEQKEQLKQDDLFTDAEKKQPPQIQITDKTIKFKQHLFATPSVIKNYPFEKTKAQQKEQIRKQGVQRKKQQKPQVIQNKPQTDTSQKTVQQPKQPQVKPRKQTLGQAKSSQSQQNLRNQKQPQKLNTNTEEQKIKEQPITTTKQQQPKEQQQKVLPPEQRAPMSSQQLAKRYQLLKKSLLTNDQQLQSKLNYDKFIQQLKDQTKWRLNAARVFIWVMILLAIFQANCRRQSDTTVQKGKYTSVSREMEAQDDMSVERMQLPK